MERQELKTEQGIIRQLKKESAVTTDTSPTWLKIPLLSALVFQGGPAALEKCGGGRLPIG